MPRPLSLAAVVLCATLAVTNAYAQRIPTEPAAPAGDCIRHDASTRPDCPAALSFLATLQDALRKNDRARIATLTAYPLHTPPIRGQRVIRNRQELLARFNLVFTPAIRSKVLAAGPNDVWGNQQGFMVNQGVIWFDDRAARPGAPSAFKLIAVNPVVQ